MCLRSITDKPGKKAVGSFSGSYFKAAQCPIFTKPGFQATTQQLWESESLHLSLATTPSASVTPEERV